MLPHSCLPCTQASSFGSAKRKAEELWAGLSAYQPPTFELPLANKEAVQQVLGAAEELMAMLPAEPAVEGEGDEEMGEQAEGGKESQHERSSADLSEDSEDAVGSDEMLPATQIVEAKGAAGGEAAQQAVPAVAQVGLFDWQECSWLLYQPCFASYLLGTAGCQLMHTTPAPPPPTHLPSRCCQRA